MQFQVESSTISSLFSYFCLSVAPQKYRGMFVTEMDDNHKPMIVSPITCSDEECNRFIAPLFLVLSQLAFVYIIMCRLPGDGEVS